MLNLNDEWYMAKALEQAQLALDANEVPIGAVVVYNNKIIAKGYNQVELLQDSTAHAEMIALTAAYQDLGAKYLMDATLYVTVEPCMMCTGALFWSKIGKVVYGTSDSRNGISKYFDLQKQDKSTSEWPFHPKTILVPSVLESTCAAMMQNFFKSLRK